MPAETFHVYTDEYRVATFYSEVYAVAYALELRRSTQYAPLVVTVRTVQADGSLLVRWRNGELV